MAYQPDDGILDVIEFASFRIPHLRKEAIKNAMKLREAKIRAEATREKKNIIEDSGECEICGFSFKPVLQIHHILPIKDFGNNTDNMICVCPTCHKILHYFYKWFDSGNEYIPDNFYKMYSKESISKINKYVLLRAIKMGEVYDFIKNS